MNLHGTIKWGQGVAIVESSDAFNDLITSLEAQAMRSRPIMIDVIADDGRSLALGLGRDKSVLSLAGSKGLPPYYASVGDENADGNISFDYYGEGTEFRLRNAVPISAARRSAVQFLSEPGLPNAVRWEEV